MKTLAKVILGMAIAGTTFFASCDGCGEKANNNTDSTTAAYQHLLQDGQSFDKDGNIVDHDGKVVKTADEVKSMAANTPKANADNNAQMDNSPLGEKDFLFAVIKANTEQIAILEAGTANCTDSAMKKAAQEMLAQHKNLRNEVNTFAQVHGYGLPDLNKEETASVDASAGMDWDRAFSKKVAGIDAELINLFERGRKSVDNKDLQVVITNFMPTLQTNRAAADSWTAAM